MIDRLFLYQNVQTDCSYEISNAKIKDQRTFLFASQRLVVAYRFQL